MIGAPDSVTIVDQIIFQGGDAAAALIQKGGLLDASYYIAGFVVYALVGLASIYTIFLLSLAKVALSILLALGPSTSPRSCSMAHGAFSRPGSGN